MLAFLAAISTQYPLGCLNLILVPTVLLLVPIVSVGLSLEADDFEHRPLTTKMVINACVFLTVETLLCVAAALVGVLVVVGIGYLT